MTELPTGTLTFLFSDIEGSTRLVQELGDRWDAVLDEHRRLMRRAIATHGGTEVGTEGDSFFVVFETASAAVEAAVAVQRAIAGHAWPDDLRLRVRMGIHTGTARRAGGGYTGIEIHRAARIMASGHGGQVLLSEVTLALAREALPDGTSSRDLGSHQLRDLSAPQHLHQLVVEGLPDEFPALRTVGTTPNNLPEEITSFLGREQELDEVTELLDRSRLVTLTGPGGSGKTRLALRVAARLLDGFPDGVWFVTLAEISEPGLVAPTVAQALAAPEPSGRSPVERIVDHLRNKRALLVLDNFEQVIAAAPSVSDILSGASEVRVLVTSRSALRLYAEQEYPVPPLALPNLEHLPEAEQVTGYSAVALFIERARAARPNLAATEETVRTIAEICVRLDGLPLAIELAAARIKVLTPEAILERLAHRLDLLAAGPRDRPARQQTLRGAIEWSYELLDERDRQLFACLSVFVGGAGMEAIERVCAGVVSGEALDGLASLVDKSLVRQSEGVGHAPRFKMLETIREFALEQSQANGRHAELQRGHAEWCLALVDELAPRIMSAEQGQILDRLEEDHGNLRAAISWATDQQQARIALRLTARLWRMWQMRGYLVEGLERARSALALPGAQAHPEERAETLEAAGGLAYWTGDAGMMRHWYQEALEVRRGLGEPAAIAEALYNLSFSYSYVTEDVSEATPEDLATARRLGEEAMEIFQQAGDRSGEGRALWALASVDALTHDFVAMEDKATRSEQVFRGVGDQFHLGWALWGTALARIGMGRLDEARAPVREALEMFAAVDDVSGVVVLVELAAIIALREANHRAAARLCGGISRLEESTGLLINPFVRAVLDFQPMQLRDDPATAEAWREGTGLDLAALSQHAFEVLTDR